MVKDVIFKIVNYVPWGRMLTGFYLLAKNHLSKSGWKKSVVRRLPVDADGKELPWLTYGCIHFIEPKLKQHFTVFEYGSGNSTFWFSNKVKSIVSVEHHPAWYQQMKKKFMSANNIEYSLKELDNGNYQNEILNYSRAFDIIVLDGRKRVECSLNSLSALKDEGVILWDNSDRTKYSQGYEFLLSNGFKRIDFYGMGPISVHSWCSSIFYRENNCLNI